MTSPAAAPETPMCDAIEAGRVNEYASATLCKYRDLACTLERANAALRWDSKILHTAGIIEIAIRNSNVSSWMKHWEDRAINAETSLASLRQEVGRAMHRMATDHGELFDFDESLEDCACTD